jgi:ribonuclease III
MDRPPPTAPASPAEPPTDPVDALAARLDQPLLDRDTALAALTHKSYVNEHRAEALADNERLEFLGDAIIDLAVSQRLMERFPEAREGDLSKMRAALVDEQGLAAMARALDLGALLRLGRGEELTGGRKKASLLADALEAVVAAIYLETGLSGVLRLVDRMLSGAFERAAAGTLDRDYKTQLQEVAQARCRTAPRYRVSAESGPDHAKVFEVELDLHGEILGRASGRSKKDAEQAAARLALEALAKRVEAPADPSPAPTPDLPAPVEPPAPAPAALHGEAKVDGPHKEAAPRRAPTRRATKVRKKVAAAKASRKAAAATPRSKRARKAPRAKR